MTTPTQEVIEYVASLTDAAIVEMVSDRDPRAAHVVQLRLKQLRLQLIQQTQQESDHANAY